MTQSSITTITIWKLICTRFQNIRVAAKKEKEEKKKSQRTCWGQLGNSSYFFIPKNIHCEYSSRKHAYIILTPIKPQFYILKLEFTGVCIIFLILLKKYRLWVLVRTACGLSRNMKNIRIFYLKISLFNPRHYIVAGYYGFTLDVRVSVLPSYVLPSVNRFRMITSKHQWIFTVFGMCIDIVEISFGIANGLSRNMKNIRIFYLKISLFKPRHYIVAGYYGFTLDVRVSVLPSYVLPSVFRFRMITSKHQWVFTVFGMCIDIVEISFGIANGQISSNFDGVIWPRHTHIFVSGWLLE